MWPFKQKLTEPVYTLRVSDCLLLMNVTIGKQNYSNAMKCVLDEDKKEILIGDICIDENRYLKHINKGYGTKMMEKLLEFVNENGYETVVGNFGVADENSATDPTHRERQIHFYKKFGFSILPSEEKPERILLTLQQRKEDMPNE